MPITINPDDTAPVGNAVAIPNPPPYTRFFTLTVPDNTQWEILGGFFQYRASERAGERRLQFEIDDANGERVWTSVVEQTVYGGETVSVEVARPDVYTPPMPPGYYAVFLALPEDAFVGPAWTVSFTELFAVDNADFWGGRLWVRQIGGGIGPPPPLGAWCEPFIPQNADDADALFTAHLERMNDLSVTF